MAAPDDVIAKTVASLRNTFKVETVAPGHCAGEPMFAALKKAYGDRYLYAVSALPFRSGSKWALTCDVAKDRRYRKMI